MTNGFVSRVLESFNYLQDFGFLCIGHESTIVRFESPRFKINVYHGRKSHEIGLELAIREWSETDTFPFSAILAPVDPDRARDYRDFATHTEEGAAEGVKQLAHAFRRCMDAGVLEDPTLLASLLARREAWAKELGLETRLARARALAEAAWRRKGYRDVVAALEPLQDHLAESELGKLEYCRRKLETEVHKE